MQHATGRVQVTRNTIAWVAVAVLSCAPADQNPPTTRTSTPGPQLLGAQPVLSLSADGGFPAVDAGFSRFAVWLTAQDDRRETIAIEPSTISLRCDEGDCVVDSRRAYTGAEEGVLAIIVDGSGSNSAAATVCTGCPTDPDNRRIAAVKALVTRLSGRTPRWRLALFDFGQAPPETFLAARLLAGYSQYAEDILAAADRLKGQGGTLLYDSVYDVAPTVAGERRFANKGAIPARVLVVSDGEDTNSTKPLTAALAVAIDAGVPIDVVGYGQADGGLLPLLAGKAYRDLRLLAAQTGGFATFTDSAAMPALFEHIADAYRVGFLEIRANAPAATVHGAVNIGEREASFSVR